MRLIFEDKHMYHCTTRHHTATHCKEHQKYATRPSALITHCHTLQLNVPLCKTHPIYAARPSAPITHCHTLQYTPHVRSKAFCTLSHTATNCNAHTMHAARPSALITHGHTLQLTVIHCTSLQHTATHNKAPSTHTTHCHAYHSLQHAARHTCCTQHGPVH